MVIMTAVTALMRKLLSVKQKGNSNAVLNISNANLPHPTSSLPVSYQTGVVTMSGTALMALTKKTVTENAKAARKREIALPTLT